MFEIIPIERRNRHVANFDPFREMEEFERRFWGSNPVTTAFRTDVEDTGDAFKLEAELPGFDKEDIQLDLDNDILTITAEHSSDKKEEDKKRNFVKRERYFGSFTRSFDVTGIDVDRIEAEYNNGVLTLTLPKKQENIPVSRRLEIK